ncbi:MAG: class I SAM-dependent methyltransferase [Bradymonadia bacterium]
MMTMNTDNKLAQLTDMLSNRLRKRSKHLRKWARRYGTDCVRLYDRDIPELPFTIDQYGPKAVVYNFADSMDDRQAKDWCAPIAQTLGMPVDNVFWKTRARQKGKDQYHRLGQSDRQFTVTELEYTFLVNLRDYLDTGLFLDHRLTRDLSTRECKGKRVLNLFAYTGSFSVYAAGRGARLVTTIDMSNRYLQWAKDNFEVNGLNAGQHEFIREDVLHWLEKNAERRAKYDLIILDPPTFSNSKRMQDSFEIERDQFLLIQACCKLLNPSGQLWFSTNKRRFKLDERIQARWTVEDLTHQTQPEDFRRRPHQCWRISHKEP